MITATIPDRRGVSSPGHLAGLTERGGEEWEQVRRALQVRPGGQSSETTRRQQDPANQNDRALPQNHAPLSGIATLRPFRSTSASTGIGSPSLQARVRRTFCTSPSCQFKLAATTRLRGRECELAETNPFRGVRTRSRRSAVAPQPGRSQKQFVEEELFCPRSGRKGANVNFGGKFNVPGANAWLPLMPSGGPDLPLTRLRQ